MSVAQGALVFTMAAVLSGLGVGVVRRMAPQLHLVDVPNERSLHSKPTPRGGGLAIWLVCAVGLAVAALAGTRPTSLALAGYLVAAALVTLVSAADDLRPLPPGARLIVQTVAAAIMTVPIAFSSLPQGGALTIGLAVAGVIWAVGLTNAYNFMDGIDGLIGAQGFIGGLVWATLALSNGLIWHATLAVLVAGASLGFLTQNWAPARVFLGDVGSTFLGFTFAFFAVSVPRSSTQLVAGLLIGWPILFDASLTLLRRALARQNLFVAHRTHLYQRMALAGWRPATVASLYAGLAIVSATAAFALWSGGLPIGWWLAGALVIGESVILLVIATRAERTTQARS